MKDKVPSTPALHAMRQAGVAFSPHQYRYEDHGGTSVAARELDVPEHQVVKTLVMQDADGTPLIVLMHGDCEVSTKQLARAIGSRHVEPCRPDVATRHTGYLVGGTSPFGTRKRVPTYVERTILDEPVVYLNGGARGLLVAIAPGELVRVLGAVPVEVAIP